MNIITADIITAIIIHLLLQYHHFLTLTGDIPTLPILRHINLSIRQIKKKFLNLGVKGLHEMIDLATFVNPLLLPVGTRIKFITTVTFVDHVMIGATGVERFLKLLKRIKLLLPKY
jgi:hypothetical protein